MTYQDILAKLKINHFLSPNGKIVVHSPIDGYEVARLDETPLADCDKIIEQAHEAFLKWRIVPAPKRGELIEWSYFENIRP